MYRFEILRIDLDNPTRAKSTDFVNQNLQILQHGINMHSATNRHPRSQPFQAPVEHFDRSCVVAALYVVIHYRRL